MKRFIIENKKTGEIYSVLNYEPGRNDDYDVYLIVNKQTQNLQYITSGELISEYKYVKE